MLLRRRLAGASVVSPGEGGESGDPADGERVDRRRGDDHQRALFLEPFVEDVHGPQLERRRVVFIALGGLLETGGDLHLRVAQNDASTLLSFRLRLTGHGVFQV